MTLRTYTRLLRTRDARRLAASFVVLAMAGTMTPVAFVLFVQGATGSFAAASLALAGYTVALGDDRQAAYALMTVMLESTYIAGPVLAGILIAAWSATAAVATIAALSLTGAVAFAASGAARRHRRWPACSWRRWPPAARSGALRTDCGATRGRRRAPTRLCACWPARASRRSSPRLASR
jgi:hypothetical protein